VSIPATRDKEAIAREAVYREARARIDALLEGEDDWVAAMATVASELHFTFDHYHWTGFYRATEDQALVIGPYQGTHGCLRIDFDRGVCGAAARTKATQLVEDVDEFPDHIACDSRTASEIVVPVLRLDGSVLAVFDVDSNDPAAFTQEDVDALEDLCAMLGEKYGRA
jgi:GAF domain-containing protein